MCQLAEALFAVEEEAEEGRLQEEGEGAFHGQRLTNDATREAREMRPVGTELEFHGNAGDDAEDEADAEDLRPEARRGVIAFVVLPQTNRLQRHHQRGQAHGELREEVVEGSGKCEVQPMYQYGGVHMPLTP